MINSQKKFDNLLNEYYTDNDRFSITAIGCRGKKSITFCHIENVSLLQQIGRADYLFKPSTSTAIDPDHYRLTHFSGSHEYKFQVLVNQAAK